MKPFYDAQFDLHINYIESSLNGKTWFLGEELSGADIMMSFPLQVALMFVPKGKFPNIERFVAQVESNEYYRKACERVGEIRIEKRCGKITRNRSETSKSSFWIGMVVFFAYLIASLYVMTNSIKLGFAMLCGLAFGLLIERAQICFTSAFRDLWVTGRAYMAKAIIFGIIVGTLGVFSYIQLGVPAKSCGQAQMPLSVVYYSVSVLC